jgi:hypothetical protein
MGFFNMESRNHPWLILGEIFQRLTFLWFKGLIVSSKHLYIIDSRPHSVYNKKLWKPKLFFIYIFSHFKNSLFKVRNLH